MTERSEVIEVVMLSVLKAPFEAWLAQRELELRKISDHRDDTIDHYMVTPTDEAFSRLPKRVRTD